jgi:tetraacyldisaccharide 4'-kinase
VSVISRGYGAAEGAVNDEALVLEANLPDVPHLQNPDRVAAAQVAIEELAAQAIVLDDAFQHRRIARDLDLVLLDALEPFGYGHLAPRGLLREPVGNLARAHVAVLTRADAVSDEVRRGIRARVAQLAPQAAWVETSHAPRALRSASGAEQPPASLAGQRVAAFCGLGNPAGFRHTLEQLGCKVAAWREFPDHHRYTREDIAALTAWAAQQGVSAVVCTQKDLVKIQVDVLGGVPLWAVTIGLEILAGHDALEARLAPCLAAAQAVVDNT